jgi:broad specificity phosphatase PhoE
MEPITFLTGMQALAAFLQVWQTERNRRKATEAYDRAMEEAPNDPAVQADARVLATFLQGQPHIRRIFDNRLARCQDTFEERFRGAPEDQLDAIARDYKRCTCLVLQAIRTAQGGDLHGPLADKWAALDCPVILAA